MTPEWIWYIFVFAFGSCIGSFLNVVIYRLPRDKSIVSPPSACPGCDNHIAFYDNIPLLSWIVLGGRCRHCKMPISPRYFIVELITGLLFLAFFYLYFVMKIRNLEIDEAQGLTAFARGGWLMYTAHILLIASLLAASGIDLELWIIPLSICWFATLVGFIGSAVAGFVIDPQTISFYDIFPVASASSGAIALGAGIGMIISLLALKFKIIHRSYECDSTVAPDTTEYPSQHPNFPHRREILKEFLFLAPIILGALIANSILNNPVNFQDKWINLLQIHAISGFLGSLYGYFIGCAIVWITRILGTLAFGKEAMGLGDVHLMGAAGAVIGPKLIVVAFFIAPFFGLAWAIYQRFSKKTPQIPYGPFLSMGIIAVMIHHDRVMDFLVGLVMLN